MAVSPGSGEAANGPADRLTEADAGQMQDGDHERAIFWFCVPYG
jgi:hypothetical protein